MPRFRTIKDFQKAALDIQASDFLINYVADCIKDGVEAVNPGKVLSTAHACLKLAEVDPALAAAAASIMDEWLSLRTNKPLDEIKEVLGNLEDYTNRRSETLRELLKEGAIENV